MSAIDHLNGQFGRETVGFGIVRQQRECPMKSDLRSPRFTTAWDELPEVKAKLGLGETEKTEMFIPPLIRSPI